MDGPHQGCLWKVENRWRRLSVFTAAADMSSLCTGHHLWYYQPLGGEAQAQQRTCQQPQIYTARLTGALPAAMTNKGKRAADVADYSKDAFNKKVCMYFVHGRLPHIAVRSSDLQDLLYMTRSALTLDDLKRPSNDTMSRMVRTLTPFDRSCLKYDKVGRSME